MKILSGSLVVQKSLKSIKGSMLRVTSKVFGEVKIPVINIRDGKEIGIDAILDTGAVYRCFYKKK